MSNSGIVFQGPSEIVGAYESALCNDVPLVGVGDFVDPSTVKELVAVGDIQNVNQRTKRFQEVLYNAVPRLEEAEALIPEWAAQGHLPADWNVHATAEATVRTHGRNTYAHSDDWTFNEPELGDMPTDLVPYVYTPFATSIGLSGEGKFRGTRFVRRLNPEELSRGFSADLEAFNRLVIGPDRSLRHVEVGLIQSLGDLVIIPGAPQPSAHEVLGTPGRTSITAGYVATRGANPSFDRLRADHEGIRKLMMEFKARQQDS